MCRILTARDLLSKILIPDPQNRAKLSELKNHPWMQHGDSGPTPSAGNNSAATNGAPPVSNTKPAQAAPVAAPPAQKAAPVQTNNVPPVAPTPVTVTPPAPPAVVETKVAAPVVVAPPAPAPVKPLEVQAPAPAAPTPAAPKPVAAPVAHHEPEQGGLFGCCKSRKQDNKQYDKV